MLEEDEPSAAGDKVDESPSVTTGEQVSLTSGDDVHQQRDDLPALPASPPTDSQSVELPSEVDPWLPAVSAARPLSPSLVSARSSSVGGGKCLQSNCRGGAVGSPHDAERCYVASSNPVQCRCCPHRVAETRRTAVDVGEVLLNWDCRQHHLTGIREETSNCLDAASGRIDFKLPGEILPVRFERFYARQQVLLSAY